MAAFLASVLVLLSARGLHAQSSASFPEPPPSPPTAAPAPAPPAPAPAAPAPSPLAPPYVAPAPAAPAPVGPAPAAPVYVPPAPAFAPSESPPAAGALASTPPILPFRKGLPVPQGYRVVDRSATGLIVGGLVTFLASYGAGLALAAGESFENGTGYVAIPVIGPWAAIGARKFGCKAPLATTIGAVQKFANQCVDRAFDEVTTVVFFTADGLVQATGAVLFFVGLGSGYQELVRSDLPQTALTVLPEGGLSLSVSGNF